jgi:hypothetical protein
MRPSVPMHPSSRLSRLPPNKSFQRTVTHKVLARGPVFSQAKKELYRIARHGMASALCLVRCRLPAALQLFRHRPCQRPSVPQRGEVLRALPAGMVRDPGSKTVIDKVHG